jgi:hypothetical protein
MISTLRNGRLLWAAALLAVPSVATAQDNASNVATANATATTDSALGDTTATDLNITNDVTTADPTLTNDLDPALATTDQTVANDLALANTVEPQREDKDFPWGLLGLLGLAGLLGRKKHDDIHVDARNNRRDV